MLAMEAEHSKHDHRQHLRQPSHGLLLILIPCLLLELGYYGCCFFAAQRTRAMRSNHRTIRPQALPAKLRPTRFTDHAIAAFDPLNPCAALWTGTNFRVLLDRWDHCMGRTPSSAACQVLNHCLCQSKRFGPVESSPTQSIGVVRIQFQAMLFNPPFPAEVIEVPVITVIKSGTPGNAPWAMCSASSHQLRAA